MTKEAARKVKTVEASPRRKPRADASRSDSRLRTIPREAIAERAYFLFLERGGEHGHDIADWLQAESELAGGRSGNGKTH